MQIHATPLGLSPPLGHRIIHIGLVYDLRYKLRSLLDERGIGRWYFGRVDRVGCAIFDEEGEKGEDGADEEEDYYEIEDKEDYETAAHGCCSG